MPHSVTLVGMAESPNLALCRQPSANGGEVATECILTGYVESAMSSATFDKLDDGTFAGRIPPCQGVAAFGTTLLECQRPLQSTLEDWLLLGLRMGHAMPVLGGLSLNGE